MKEKITNLIEWANRRLLLIGEPLTTKQKEYIIFSIGASDFIEKEDVRNKLTPIKNLIAMLENENTRFSSDDSINELIKTEINQSKLSIEYLSL